MEKTRRAIRRLGGDDQRSAQESRSRNFAAAYSKKVKSTRTNKPAITPFVRNNFLTDKERGPDGEFGPEWGEIEFREEENYYFKLSQHKDWLLRYLDNRADAVIPDFRQTELRNAVEKISGDLCISRPKSRLDWGIELPFDKDFVTYVWFDALTNYISFAGYDPSLSTFNSQPSTFRDKWPALQIIGKDILVPAHGIYWLIMLHAIGFPDDQMPQLLVHGWWNLGGAKMSKSVGNIVDPFVLADKYGADALRYYLMSDIATGQDADFSEERLVERYNTDLANSLGNLLNRTLNMAQRYRDGRLHRGKLGAPSNCSRSANLERSQSYHRFFSRMPTWRGIAIDLGNYLGLQSVRGSEFALDACERSKNSMNSTLCFTTLLMSYASSRF